MILYDYYRSSAAYRVRIALNLKGLKAGQRSVHLRKGEQRGADYKSVNPQGLVPTLDIGGARLTQSLAIIEYLDEKYPEPPLVPRNAEDRAFARAIALSIACDIHPLNNTRVLAYLGKELGIDEPKRDDWYRHWVQVGFEALETQLGERGSGTYALGSSPTIADVFIVPQVANANRLKVPMEPYPRINAINATCLKLQAFADARPEVHPHAE
ncbi:MAG TPA: maleylacetoacetate isomerase [Usitatibacter sp.]|nr:maleylacetoacetate isomerase [Usitatibacter sp.]